MTTAPDEPAGNLDAAIGERVHTLLWQRRSPQIALARILGITSSVLSKKLRGESAWSARQVATAAYALGVTAGELYGEAPGHPGPPPDDGSEVGPARLELAPYGLVVPTFGVAA